MKPSQLANQLRLMASKIDRSKKPDRRLVANDLKRIVGTLNETVNIDHNAVKSAIEKAFSEIQNGKDVVGVGSGEPFDTLSSQYEYFITMNSDDGMITILSTVHHDTDVVYNSSLGDFDIEEATKDVISDMEAGMEQFTEMFP